MSSVVEIASRIQVANDRPFVLFGGINVLESRELALQACETYVTITEELGMQALDGHGIQSLFEHGFKRVFPAALDAHPLP